MTNLSIKLKSLLLSLLPSLCLLSACLSLFLSHFHFRAKAQPSTPAFPGAEGGGAGTTGGRGGRVIEVTNTNDSGTGSLRTCIDASGPRTCIFRTGGTISITTPLHIQNPYITIAGQTAPGGGILIKATEVSDNAIRVETHDVVIRYLRIRHGRGPAASKHQNIFIQDGSYNIIIDHCSLSWASNENLTVNSISNPIAHVTISWNIIGEGLYGEQSDFHGAGISVSSINRADLLENISIHHNFFLHNQFRNPYMKGKSAEVINNIAYDWQYWAMLIRAGIEIDIVGNSFKVGPNFSNQDLTHDRGIIWSNVPGDNGDHGVPGTPSIYIKGNQDYYQTDPDADNWDMIDEVHYLQSTGHPPSRDFERLTPRDTSFPITIYHVSELEDILFAEAGASKRLDQNGNWVVNRDVIDARYIEEYQNATGILPVHEDEVGGFPSIDPGIPYTDSDHDGMADHWEILHFGDIISRGDANDSSGDYDTDGYTDLEEFLNSTNPKENDSLHCFPLGDIDCSTKVNMLDFGYLASKWGTSDPKADLDNSDNLNIVNALDARVLLANYGLSNEDLSTKGQEPPPQILCSPEEKRCSKKSVQTCSQDGTQWVTTKICSRGAKCDPTTMTCVK